MSGVELSSLARRGSALSSGESSLISGASAVRAASRNGVAPIELSVVTPMVDAPGHACVEGGPFRHEFHESQAVHVAGTLGWIAAPGDARLAHP